MSEDKRPALPVTDPPVSDPQVKRSIPLSSAALMLIIVGFGAIVILLYQWVAKAVIFEIQPQHSRIHVTGLSFNIGNNYLLLNGDYKVAVTALGYYPLDSSITVTEQSLQTFNFNLQPLPGTLSVRSELDNIKVTIDDHKNVIVPGSIEGLNRGPHQFTFSKYRYFPKTQQIDIVGLGETQEISLSLEPAWGEMTFNSQPQQAHFYVDDQFVGTTPLTTEILETGSNIRLELEGYKVYKEQVKVKAGSSAQHPSISMTVSDGLLNVTSNPTAANVTLDNQFLGTTPLSTQLPPFKKYRLELFKQGYLKTIQSVNLKPETTTRVRAELKPDIGTISVNVLPADAEIQVDGQSQGNGSRTLSLSTSPHQLTVQKTGYQSQSLSITPRANQSQAVEVSLLTLEEAYWATKPQQIGTVAGSALTLFRPNQVFTLGAPRRQPGRRANEVQRRVSLHRPFYMGITEISNRQFRRWRDHNSSAIRGKSLDMDNQPAVNLSWNEAALYCNWLSQQQGLPEFYQVVNGQISGFNWAAHGYRLPTEAEWAWSAKVAQDGQIKTFGWKTDLYPPSRVTDNYADEHGKGIISFLITGYDDGHAVSSPVGSYKPNTKGLYNISGNVSEWVNDYYDLQPNMADIIEDPKGPEQGNRHVIRGASWALSSRGELRLSYREAGNQGRLDVGFRIARYVDSPGAQP